MILNLMATLILAGAPVKTAAATSNLLLSSDGPKLRVTIDGKAYGKYTEKALTIDGIAAGKHDVVITWIDGGLTKAPVKKTVYTGKLMVDAGKEMRIRVVPEGIQITDEVALAKDEGPKVVGAPVKDFSNSPSILHIQSEKFMAMVLIDGTPLQQGDCTSPKACTVADLTPGQHDVEIRGGAFGTKPIFKGLVAITGGAEVFGKATGNNEFQIYNTQARTDLAVAVAPAPTTEVTQTTTTTTVGGDDVGGANVQMSFVDPDTGERIHMGVSAGPMGGSSTVTHQTTTTTTTVNGGLSSQSSVVMHQGPGTIEFTSQDGESFLVFVDGKKVGQFIGISGQSVKLRNIASGEHKLEIKSFPIGDQTLAAGRLYMDPGFDLKMGYGQDLGLEAYNRPNAWDPAN